MRLFIRISFIPPETQWPDEPGGKYIQEPRITQRSIENDEGPHLSQVSKIKAMFSRVIGILLGIHRYNEVQPSPAISHNGYYYGAVFEIANSSHPDPLSFSLINHEFSLSFRPVALPAPPEF